MPDADQCRVCGVGRFLSIKGTLGAIESDISKRGLVMLAGKTVVASARELGLATGESAKSLYNTVSGALVGKPSTNSPTDAATNNAAEPKKKSNPFKRERRNEGRWGIMGSRIGNSLADAGTNGGRRNPRRSLAVCSNSLRRSKKNVLCWIPTCQVFFKIFEEIHNPMLRATLAYKYVVIAAMVSQINHCSTHAFAD